MKFELVAIIMTLAAPGSDQSEPTSVLAILDAPIFFHISRLAPASDPRKQNWEPHDSWTQKFIHCFQTGRDRQSYYEQFHTMFWWFCTHPGLPNSTSSR